jgi:tRNA A-37 threonylcarbamoyl transferase component Bud32
MPDTLGKYDLLHILGKGAMGVVYEGFDPIIGRRLAIKTVRIPDAGDVEAQDELARFKREAQAAGRLGHPNVVGVFDYGETPELAYIVMEFVDGTTLKHVLDRNERFELAEIVRIMRGLLAGLQYSHERGVVHRDIKPANVMLTKSGEVKIADFGIARIESSSLTQAGTMLGTPSYMSPEQFMGQTVDSRTDIYSTGVMLYQLLTGEKPFEGGLTAIMHKVLNTEPPPPSALSVTVPHAFDAVVQRAMSKRPSQRFASAQEFATALQEAFENRADLQIGLMVSDLADDDATLVVTSRPVMAAVIPSAAAGTAAADMPPLPPAAKRFPKLALAAGAGALIIAGAAGFLVHDHVHDHGGSATQVPAPATPAVPEPPPLTGAERDALLQSTLGALPCTLITVIDDGDKYQITGLAGAGAPQAALTAALNSLPSNVPTRSNVQTIDGPYCAALDTIRPYNAFFAKPGVQLNLNLAGGATTLHDGQLITVKEKMPAYAGYLQTDYFSGDGTVFHLYPTRSDPLKVQLGGSTKTLGDPNKGGASWQVSAPYGTDMIMSTVTASPLFAALRPQIENASDYLPALREALQNAASAGQNLEVDAKQLVTEPKQ